MGYGRILWQSQATGKGNAYFEENNSKGELG